jgi:hypothetical protein
MRSALRTTVTLASSASGSMRPVVGRGIARPMLAQTSGVMKRNYHEKVIDHYENPRNVRGLADMVQK